MNIKIFVAYHSNSDIFQDEIYTPIQVGRSLSELIPGMVGDNTGDNISNKNKIYSEMTAMYWVWKNCNDLEYIGLCHYRRFYTFEKDYITLLKKKVIYFISRIFIGPTKPGFNFINDNGLVINSKKELDSVNSIFSERLKKEMFKYDMITLYPIEFSGIDVKTLFSKPSGEYHIRILENILSEKYPHLLKYFKLQCVSNQLYPANMCIMKKVVFNEYASFIFNTLETHEIYCVKDEWCYDTLKEKSFYRLSGYLSEILTSTFVNYCKDKSAFNIKYVHQVFYDSSE